MYNILLVDDEPWVIESYKRKMQWEDYGFTIMDHALNGYEALQKIAAAPSDLIITDIRMPGMSGIELIEKVKAFSEDIEIIVMSGYAEFSYAQKAINRGAIGYCLKPLNPADIVELLNRTKELFDARAGGAPDFLYMYEQMASKAGSIKEAYRGSLQKSTSGSYRIAIQLGCIGEQLESHDWLEARLGLGKKAFLIPEEQLEAFRKLSKEHLHAQTTKGIGISLPIRDLGEMERAVDEADIAAHQIFVTGKVDVFDYRWEKERHGKQMEELLPSFNYGRDQSAVGNAKASPIVKMIEYVNHNYDRDISLFSVSQTFNMNLSYASQLFKKETGVTFTKYLTDLRMNQACNLLINSNLTVQEITDKTGYHDYFYFTKLFKKLMHTTPSAYRQSQR
jgi:two-component system response regulator YesN